MLQVGSAVDEQSVPRSHTAAVQLGEIPHADGAHVTSHAHDVLQSAPRSHAPLPVHATTHRPAPQSTGSSHEPFPMQLTAHAVASWQSTPFAQLLLPAQLTTQSMSGGQLTVPKHEPGVGQSIVHTV